MPRPTRPDAALGAVLRRLRDERGESQEQLAYKADMTAGALGRIELGQSSPAWATVQDIAAALDIPMVDLVAAVEADR